MIQNALVLVHSATEPRRSGHPERGYLVVSFQGPDIESRSTEFYEAVKHIKGLRTKTTANANLLWVMCYMATDDIETMLRVIVACARKCKASCLRVTGDPHHLPLQVTAELVEAVRRGAGLLSISGQKRDLDMFSTTAAAEPPSGTRTGDLGAALTALVDRRFRVSGPGVTHAVLTRAVPGMRWNSREWSIATTWEVHLHADMRVSTLVDINVEMNETGATFSSHNRHKVVGADPFADTMHVPQLTLDKADANNAAAAKAIVSVCKKMLLKRMDAHDNAYASAEPRPGRASDMLKLIKPPFPLTVRDGVTLKFTQNPTWAGVWHFTAGRKRRSDVLGKVMESEANVEVRGPERVLGTEVIRITHAETPVELFKQIVDAAFKIAKSEGL